MRERERLFLAPFGWSVACLFVGHSTLLVVFGIPSRQVPHFTSSAKQFSFWLIPKFL